MENDQWNEYIRKLLESEKWEPPNNASTNIPTHQPIYPVWVPKRYELSEDEWRIYELIGKHFLATVSKDAIFELTTINWIVNSEVFTLTTRKNIEK